jgi:hypothetical protein
MDKIYVVVGTQQTGPFTEAEIRSQLASGALTGDSMVWWEGLPEWTPLSRTPLAAPAGAPGIPATTPVGPGAVAPVGTKTSGLAITSLVTGVAAVPTAFCYGLGVIPGIVAVVTGHIARKRIKRDPTEGGEGMALAGLICGYISIGLMFLGIIAVCVLIALGNQVKSVFSQIQSTQMTNNAPATPDSDTTNSDTNSPSTNSPPTTPAPSQ